MKIIDSEKRFVKIALDKCYITGKQFLEALKIQEKEIIEENQYLYLPILFLEYGFMEFSQVNEVFLETYGSPIFESPLKMG